MQVFLALAIHLQDDVEGHMFQQKKWHSKIYFILAGARRYSPHRQVPIKQRREDGRHPQAWKLRYPIEYFKSLEAIESETAVSCN